MRIVNLNRFVRGIVIVFILLLLISVFISNKSLSYNSKTYKKIYVSSGDTLWSIASDLQNTNYFKGKDIRSIIQEIKEINKLSNSNLSVGDEIIIPVI